MFEPPSVQDTIFRTNTQIITKEFPSPNHVPLNMTMQRLASRLATARCTPAFTSTRLAIPVSARTYGSSSSPKSAEKASAQSGGSRSKEATEKGSSPTGGILGGNKDNIPNEESSSAPTEGIVPDELANGSVRGRTGGGEALSSSQDAPKKPKVDSHSLPGGDPKLTKEQQKEVDEHNREFEAKHGRAQPAEDDKVDPKYWSNKGKETGAL
ncbi:hypothetical protein V8F20_012742 [Naviculisporaceae sp. PSN 640]